MLDQQYHEELRALRDLEKAVRAYALTAEIISEYQRTSMLALALKNVTKARKRSIAKSKISSYRENNE